MSTKNLEHVSQLASLIAPFEVPSSQGIASDAGVLPMSLRSVLFLQK